MFRLKLFITIVGANLLLSRVSFGEFEYNGSASYEAKKVFGSEVFPGHITTNNTMRMELEAKYQPSDEYVVYMNSFGRYDANDEDRNDFRFDELWLQKLGYNWDVKIGNQIVTWGSMESVSRVDVINPRDYRDDFLDPRKIGVPAMQFRWLGEVSTISAYYLPIYSASQYPGEKATYSPSQGGAIKNPETENANQYALRYFYVGDSADFAISYFNGYERDLYYSYIPASNIMQGNTFKTDRYSFEVTGVYNSWLLKAEYVNRRPKNDEIKNSNLVTLGVEYTENGLVGNEDTTLYAEYFYDSEKNGSLGLLPLQNDLFVGVRMRLNDQNRQEITIGTMRDLDNSKRYLYRLQYENWLSDSFAIQVEYQDSHAFYSNSDLDADGIGKLQVKYTF